MISGDSSEWFLEVEGKRIGPYTIEHILGLLQEGEILPYHRVTSDSVGAEWMSVQELKNLIKAQPGGGMLFQPPPRPVALDTPAESRVSSDGSDPTLSLFDALQSVKGGKPSRAAPPSKEGKKKKEISAAEETSQEAVSNRDSNYLWYGSAALAGLAALLIGVGVYYKLQSSAEKVASAPTPAAAFRPATPSLGAVKSPDSDPAKPIIKQPFTFTRPQFTARPAPLPLPKTAHIDSPRRIDDRARGRDREESDRDRERDRAADERDSRPEIDDARSRGLEVAPASVGAPVAPIDPYDPNRAAGNGGGVIDTPGTNPNFPSPGAPTDSFAPPR